MIYFVLGLILGFCIIMIITEFTPDSPKRKALIKRATGSYDYYDGCPKKFQPTNEELKEIAKKRRANLKE